MSTTAPGSVLDTPSKNDSSEPSQDQITSALTTFKAIRNPNACPELVETLHGLQGVNLFGNSNPNNYVAQHQLPHQHTHYLYQGIGNSNGTGNVEDRSLPPEERTTLLKCSFLLLFNPEKKVDDDSDDDADGIHSLIGFDDDLYLAKSIDSIRVLLKDLKGKKLFRDHQLITSVIQSVSVVIVRRDDATKEEAMKFLKDVFKLIQDVVKEDKREGERVLKCLNKDSTQDSIFLEGNGDNGYASVNDKNIVLMGFYFTVNIILKSHPNITDKYKNISINLLGKFSDKITDKTFADLGGFTSASDLYQASKNKAHKKILHKIIGDCHQKSSTLYNN